MVGYYQDSGFFALATLAFDPTSDILSPLGDTLDYGGSGYLFDIGYNVKFGSYSLGPMLTYGVVTFSKETQNSHAVQTHASMSQTIVQPQFCLFFDL